MAGPTATSATAGAAQPAVRRTGVLGGTFDPPHLAHLALGAAAKRALSLDRVVFVPNGNPYHKRDHGREISPPAARLRMIEAATAHLEWAEVSAIEVAREGPTYTLDTLEELSSNDGNFWFILGEDALGDLPKWKEPARLIELTRLAVARRSSTGASPMPALPEAVLAAVPGITTRIDGIPMPPLDISATDLRERIRAGRPTAYLLPEAVRAVVDELGLYRG